MLSEEESEKIRIQTNAEWAIENLVLTFLWICREHGIDPLLTLATIFKEESEKRLELEKKVRL